MSRCLQDPKTPGRNRGFAFVEYYNHACAEHARREMSKPSFRLGSNAPTISWADPRSGPDANAMSQVPLISAVIVWFAISWIFLLFCSSSLFSWRLELYLSFNMSNPVAWDL
jgi:RNA recognition motif-containing protein